MSSTSSTSISGNVVTGSTISQNERPSLYRRHSPLRINELVDNTSDSQVEQTYQDTGAVSVSMPDSAHAEIGRAEDIGDSRKQGGGAGSSLLSSASSETLVTRSPSGRDCLVMDGSGKVMAESGNVEDGSGKVVDKRGNMVDESGKVVNTDSNMVDDSSNMVDKSSNTIDNGTILDKVTSHPLITSSINYMLERTIHTSSCYLKAAPGSGGYPEKPCEPHDPSIDVSQSVCGKTQDTNRAKYMEHAKRLRSSVNTFESTGLATAKRPKLSTVKQRGLLTENKLPPPIPTGYGVPWAQPTVLPRIAGSLRQQVTVNSAISAQRSLQDLTELSVINLNIESRRRLEMLIHFLKLGNGQLSERIENLIRQVESVSRKREGVDVGAKKRQSIDSTSGNRKSIDSASSNGGLYGFSSGTENSDEASSNDEGYSQFISDDSVQQIKNDIVATVKKIVSVVSKVSASSLSEPARSNVREALLKLPSNWATMFEREKRHGAAENGLSDDEDNSGCASSENELDDSSSVDTSSVDTRYEDSMEFQNADGEDSNPGTGSRSLATPSLFSNLFRYKGGLSRGSVASTRARRWLRRKIRSQMSYDTNGKVLVLAQESLDMINKIIKFCNENLDKAETWNSSKQDQQRENLRNKLEDMDYVSTPGRRGGD